MLDESKIVIPWDFSEQSKCALEFALEKTARKNIHVICILERPEPYTLGGWGEEQELKSLKKCEEHFWQLTPQEASGLHFTAKFGNAPDGIVQFARSINAGLILMSTHGRSGIKGLLMGSVARRVTQLADCPVLLLPESWWHARTATDNSDKVAAVVPNTSGV